MYVRDVRFLQKGSIARGGHNRPRHWNTRLEVGGLFVFVVGHTLLSHGERSAKHRQSVIFPSDIPVRCPPLPDDTGLHPAGSSQRDYSVLQTSVV